MQPKVLTPQQIQQFITCGWTKIEEAFPRTQATKVQAFLWDKLAERGILQADETTWKNPMEFIAENYNGSPFDECATARLADAISDLVGAGRWTAEKETGWWGWWPVNFAIGADQPWDVPADEWHLDMRTEGSSVTSPDQGLLVICLFSELQQRGGGTLVCEGSHQIAARLLNETSGLTQNEFNEKMRTGHPYLRALCGRDGDSNTPGTDTGNARGANAAMLERVQNDAKTKRIEKFMDETFVDEHGTELRVTEVTGSPGDVILAHPLMMHSPSFNHSGVPRFMCNRKTPLFEPMQLQREDGEYSPLEESIRQALAAT
ncbi:MAG: hypothetical protein ABI210_15335 [Abditibacteriaceae bacterium]